MIADQIKDNHVEDIICPRCDCKYENRNTTMIKVEQTTNLSVSFTQQRFLFQIVVIIVIWIISLLVIYMLFLICLDPLLNKRIHRTTTNIGYHEHNDEEVDIL